MSSRTTALILLSMAFGLAPCSSEEAQSGRPAGAGRAAEGSQGSCDAGKLVGLWAGARYSMKILGDMTYHASGTPNMANIDVIGTIQVDKCNAKIVDTSGKLACPTTDIGRYTFTVTDTKLTFAVVSDPCDGRRIPLTRGPLTKK